MEKKEYSIKERREIAARLRSTRESSDYTQENFAEVLGVSASAYKKVEEGENRISLAILRELRQKLNVSADYILYGDNQSLEDVWSRVLNCSEPDKMLIFIRLLEYFTIIKKSTFPLKGDNKGESEEILKIIQEIHMNGENR